MLSNSIIMETINQFIIVTTVLSSICAALWFASLYSAAKKEIYKLCGEYASIIVDRNQCRESIKKLSADREEMIKHLGEGINQNESPEEILRQLRTWHAHLSYKKVGSALNFGSQQSFLQQPIGYSSSFYGPENPLGPKI